MTGIIRPPRGRQSRVTKYPNASRRPGRHQAPLADVAAAASALDPDLRQVDGDEEVKEPSVVGAEDDGMADAEAESELDDEVAVAAAVAVAHQHAQHRHHAHDQVDNLELNSAAAILANGGALLPDDGGLAPAAAYPPAAHVEGFAPAHHAPQQHGHAGPLPDGSRTTLQMAHESGYPTVVGESTLAKKLAGEPGQRLAQQRRPDQALNLARRSNVEALFAHIAGHVVLSAPCKNCRKGHGPWTSCVVIDGQMCGSCANCWFNASGARCSFHGECPPPSPSSGTEANRDARGQTAKTPSRSSSSSNRRASSSTAPFTDCPRSGRCRTPTPTICRRPRSRKAAPRWHIWTSAPPCL